MPKSDDKGEPVKVVRIGGREVEVPIIFVLPEEAGEKEIERYERPKVSIKKEDKAAESEEESLEELTDGKLEEVEKPKVDDEEDTPYFDMLSDKPKKKKKKEDVSYRSLFDKGYGKAQALRRSVEEQKKRGAKTDDELAAEKEKEIPKGQQGFLNYNYLHNQPDIEDKKDYLTDEEGDEIEKSWEKWLNKKGALGEGQGDWRIGGEPKNTPKDPKDYSQWEKHLYGDSNRARDALGVSDMQSHGGQSTSERRGFMDEDLHESTTEEQTNPKTKFPWDEEKDAYLKRVPISSSPVSSAGNKPRSTSKEPAPQDEGKPDQRADPRTLKSWEKWLQKKQTRIDRKQEWGDKSKIGVGSWEDNPELKPKGRFDKDGKRIPEKGQGEGKLREGAL